MVETISYVRCKKFAFTRQITDTIYYSLSRPLGLLIRVMSPNSIYIFVVQILDKSIPNPKLYILSMECLLTRSSLWKVSFCQLDSLAAIYKFDPHDVKSTSMTLIQRRYNVVYPVGRVLAAFDCFPVSYSLRPNSDQEAKLLI